MAVPIYSAWRTETAVESDATRAAFRGFLQIVLWLRASTSATEPTKGRAMSFDLFMNDTCPRCRKPIKLARIERHPTRHDLTVHKFECAECGGVTTRVVFRKQVAA